MENPEKESYIEMDFNYGILSKTLMKDRNIDIKGKAIYALLCTYAGSSRTAFPGVGLILADLGISKDTYYKHMSKLREFGYVRVRQENRGNGTFASNVYTLSPCPNSPDAAKPDTDSPDTENQDTNNNSLKSNNTKNNNKTPPLVATQLAGRLFNWIKKNFPDISHDEKHLPKWSEDIDKINRIDGKSWEEITKVIDWSQQDFFWRDNIQSGKTLRKQFQKLQVKIASEKNKAPNGKPFVPYVAIGGSARKNEPIEDKRASINSEGVKKFKEMRKKLLNKQTP